MYLTVTLRKSTCVAVRFLIQRETTVIWDWQTHYFILGVLCNWIIFKYYPIMRTIRHTITSESLTTVGPHCMGNCHSGRSHNAITSLIIKVPSTYRSHNNNRFCLQNNKLKIRVTKCMHILFHTKCYRIEFMMIWFPYND